MTKSKRNIFTLTAFLLLSAACLFLVGVWSSAPLSLVTRRWFIIGHIISMGIATGAATIAWHKETDYLKRRIIIESASAMFFAAACASWRW